jgi:hypothetical protein
MKIPDPFLAPYFNRVTAHCGRLFGHVIKKDGKKVDGFRPGPLLFEHAEENEDCILFDEMSKEEKKQWREDQEKAKWAQLDQVNNFWMKINIAASREHHIADLIDWKAVEVGPARYVPNCSFSSTPSQLRIIGWNDGEPLLLREYTMDESGPVVAPVSNYDFYESKTHYSTEELTGELINCGQRPRLWLQYMSVPDSLLYNSRRYWNRPSYDVIDKAVGEIRDVSNTGLLVQRQEVAGLSDT